MLTPMETTLEIAEGAASTALTSGSVRWRRCGHSPSGWRSSRSRTRGSWAGPGRTSPGGSASPSRPCTASTASGSGAGNARAPDPGHPHLFRPRPGTRMQTHPSLRQRRASHDYLRLRCLPGPSRPARAVLHKYGATVEDVGEEIARRAGPGAVFFGGLDRDALAAIGIDLDAVRARIESSFGPEALT